MKKRNIFLREMENRPLGWVILIAVTLLFFVLCRLSLLQLPSTENGKVLLQLVLGLLWFLFAVFYGFFAYQMTGKVFLPCLSFAFLGALYCLSDTSGMLEAMLSANATGMCFADLFYYFGHSLKFTLVSFAIGIYTKNVR